jgi:hypothetical protein
MNSIARILSLFLALSFAFYKVSFSQYERKSVAAARIEQPPKIDGLLDEACWQTALPTGDFIMDTPSPGIPLTQKT